MTKPPTMTTTTLPVNHALYLFLAAILIFVASRSSAQSTDMPTIIFQEDFEGTSGTALPSGWTVLPGKFGESAPNPLPSGIDTSNRVLTFSAPTGDGDTYSSVFDLSPYKTNGEDVVLTFDFLSTATYNHAGLIGARFQVGGDGPPFIAGSPAAQAGVGLTTVFSGTGQWEQVSVDLSSYINAQTSEQLQTSYLFFEWWDRSDVVDSATPVYFDNLVVEAVPEPSTYAALLGTAVLGYALIRKKQMMA